VKQNIKIYTIPYIIYNIFLYFASVTLKKKKKKKKEKKEKKGGERNHGPPSPPPLPPFPYPFLVCNMDMTPWGHVFIMSVLCHLYLYYTRLNLSKGNVCFSVCTRECLIPVLLL
jgi:hypothetical protein